MNLCIYNNVKIYKTSKYCEKCRETDKSTITERHFNILLVSGQSSRQKE